jgi:EAL domain-containing protein (putative c-di-GMP-specific phosphodiesterase class I)
MDEFYKLIEDIDITIKDQLSTIDDKNVHIRINCGISTNKEHILLYADVSLKKARKENKLYIKNERDTIALKEYQEELEWKNKIIDGLKHDKFTPFFQPIVDAKTSDLISYEVLIRLVDGYDVYSPFKFLEIAKYINLYSELTKTMIRKSFEKFHGTDIRFSLNFEIEDIRNDDTMAYFKSMLYKYSGIHNQLTIEIVESEGIENFDEINEFIKSIKKLGCKVAIDDFGTGYSNFEYIMKLNVDYIKIDGSLVREIVECETHYNVVATIVKMAKENNLNVVAEYVSNIDIYKKAIELDIDYVQGYYIKEPSMDV